MNLNFATISQGLLGVWTRAANVGVKVADKAAQAFHFVNGSDSPGLDTFYRLENRRHGIVDARPYGQQPRDRFSPPYFPL